MYERYVNALISEFELRYPDRRECRLETLFIGGGTPTVLLAELLVKIIEHCRILFGFAGGAEISTEANPGTVDLETLKSLRGCGVNRLSLGAQSFFADELSIIGRVYEPDDIFMAFENARKAGFENISLDLMYGLPGQTVERWRENLEEAIGLGPEHLSLYQLSIDENTAVSHVISKRQP